MAIQGTIKVRTGLEADFDPYKMIAGEWAVSTDMKYVRMCFAPGVCFRMATYEAFEDDMETIEAILKETQDIQTAIKLIQKEVNGKSELVAENTALAEEYMKKAKEYAEQTGAFTGVQVAKNDLIGVVKGGDVHVEEDGSLRHFVKGAGQSFAVENTYEAPFADYKMFGKSVQETVPGNQLFDGELELGTLNAVGNNQSSEESVRTKNYIPVNGGIAVTLSNDKNYTNYIYEYDIDKNYISRLGKETTNTVTLNEATKFIRFCSAASSVQNDLTVKYMLNAGSEPLPWEPYVGGIASPNPEYPQPIVSVGEKLIDGVVTDVGIGNEICGKNLLNMSGAKGYADNGITVTINDDGSYSYVGTATSAAINVWMLGAYRGTSPILKLKANTPYYVQGCSLYETESPTLTITIISLEYGTSKVIILDTDRYVTGVRATAAVTGKTYNGTCYPMIVESDVAVEWEPYTDQSHTLNRTLRAIPVTDASLANYTDESGQMWCADTIEEVDGKMCLVERVGSFNATLNRVANGLTNTHELRCTAPSDGQWSNTNYLIAQHGIRVQDVKPGITTTWGSDVIGIMAYAGTKEIAIRTSLDVTNLETVISYILATPIITELTDEEISAIESMHSYNGATTVMSDAWTEVEAATSNVAALSAKAYRMAELGSLEIEKLKNTVLTQESITVSSDGIISFNWL